MKTKLAVRLLLLLGIVTAMLICHQHIAFAESKETENEFGNHNMREWMPYTTVIIDAGHGGIDGGASFEQIFEKDINLQVASKLYLLLESKQIHAVLNRKGDYALSDENRWHKIKSRHLRDLSQRSGLAKQMEHRIFVSIHCNASPNKRANGPVVIHQKSGESYLLASELQNHLNQALSAKRLPVAASNFYLLKYVKSPAVIVELGFISNPSDREKLTNLSSQTEIAEALASAISHYFLIYN